MAIGAQSTQEFVPISEIKNGTVIMKDGSYRAVLLCSSINFSLKSQDEQQGILGQFQNFLNSIDFPIQISVESRRKDIKPYLTYLNSLEDKQSNDLLRIQLREYISFIKTINERTNIMSKKFFITIPYLPVALSTKKSGGMFGSKTNTAKSEDVEESQIQLEERVTIVSSGLQSMGLRVARLNTESLIELYYHRFNPGAADTPAAPTE